MAEHGYWIVFLSTAVLLNCTPGPDMIYLITQTLTHGRKTGFASVLGLGTGALIHTLFVALGISVIIKTSIIVFTVIKICGAGYLFYLGMRALFSGSGIDFTNTNPLSEQKPFFKAFYQAVIIDVTNPKVALFFIALLPQFYRDNGTSQMSQFLLLGVLIVLIGFVIEGIIVLAADRLAQGLRRQPLAAKILDKIFGCVMLGLGLKLLFEKQK